MADQKNNFVSTNEGEGLLEILRMELPVLEEKLSILNLTLESPEFLTPGERIQAKFYKSFIEELLAQWKKTQNEKIIKDLKAVALSLCCNDAIVDTVYPHEVSGGPNGRTTFEIVLEVLEELGCDSIAFNEEVELFCLKPKGE